VSELLARHRSNEYPDCAWFSGFVGPAKNWPFLEVHLKPTIYLALVVLAWINRTYAQNATIPPFCDAELVDKSDNKYGYRYRGDRCEGNYEEPTASLPINLAIVSFSCRNPGLKLSSSKPAISWANADDSPVSIRIETLPQIRLRYRLDAVSAGSKTRFSWDGETWRALSIDSGTVAIVVKGRPKIGGNAFPGTLLEAHLGTEASIPACPSGPTFELRGDRPLSSVIFCATPLAQDGNPRGAAVCKTVDGSSLPGSSVAVTLGALKSATGMLQISLQGILQSGTSPSPPRYFRVKVD